MGYTSEQYLQQTKALLPRGQLWDSLNENGTTFESLLHALAEELARIDARIEDLFNELDPRTIYELLNEWEEWAGLPDSCITDNQTLLQRRESLLTQLTNDNGQSRQFFIDLAESLSYTITITEFSAFNVNSMVDEPIYDSDWNFVWQINAPETTIKYFTVESPVDEALSTWGNQQLECIIKKYVHAHRHVLFVYQ